MDQDFQEQIYFGGPIYTMESNQKVEAIAVRHGKIVTTGSKANCLSALGHAPKEIHLEGRTLLPGFIDTHLHPFLMMYFALNLDLKDVTTLDKLAQALKAKARSVGPDNWVVGLQFDEQALSPPELPPLSFLDEVCPNNLLVILMHNGHMAIGNSLAMKKAQLTPETKAPAGGEIDRTLQGKLRGVFRETAMHLLTNAIPRPAMKDIEEGSKQVFQTLLSYGITSAGVIIQAGAEGPAGSSGSLEVPLLLGCSDFIPLNLNVYVVSNHPKQVLALRKALSQRDPNVDLNIAGLKIFADGTFGSCTACMIQPFSDAEDKKGYMTLGEDEIYKRMVAAHNAGLQIAVHAIGDRGNQKCIALYKKLLEEYPRQNHRHRIEHASLLDGKMIQEIKQLGLVISTQPLFVRSEKAWLHKRLGHERSQYVYPFKDLFDHQVPTAGASDAPIESANVMEAIQCSITRDGFETHQCLSVQEAIEMFTTKAAYIQFEDHLKGSIAPGRRADFTILTEDPWQTPVEEIGQILVDETIIAGVSRYRRHQPEETPKGKLQWGPFLGKYFNYLVARALPSPLLQSKQPRNNS